jgi:hypothetical protein
MLFDCFISWLYMRVLKLFLGKIFFCKLSSSFRFSVWSVRTDLLLCPDACSSDVRTVKWHVRTRAVLPIANLAVDHLDECVPRSDAFFSGILFAACFLCHSHYTPLFSYFVMLLVFLANFSQDFGILCTSLLIPWFLLCLPLFF